MPAILIPDGENEHTLLTTRCLAQTRCLPKSQRAKTYILSSTRWSPVRFSRHPHLYQFRATGTDYQARLHAIIDSIKRFNIDVILPVSEEGIEFVITHRQILSNLSAVPLLPSLESFKTARNKWLLNQLARQHHIPSPQSILVTLDSEFYQQLSNLEYPVLLKPTSQSGGQGIRRFKTQTDLQNFLQQRDEQQFKNNYLVQSYLPGLDLGLSVLCDRGEILAFTIQKELIANKHRFGPQMAMQFIAQEDVLNHGKRLLAALNWSGVAHVDMREDNRDGQVKLLEINARYWGSLLGSLVAGVNFPVLAYQKALNIPFSLPNNQFSRYVHTTTALKELLLQPLGRSSLKRFAFKETGLRFFITDPLPEIVRTIKRLAHAVIPS
jgi:predicted ATP-grasp superfamily ATP-dependent carboligase